MFKIWSQQSLKKWSGTKLDSSAFVPTNLGSMYLWHDSGDITTPSVYQDTAGTIPVTTAGQPVARVNDRSGNGRHVTNATTGPDFTTTGKNSAVYDGISDYLAAAAASDFTFLHNGSTYDAIFLIKTNNLTVSQIVLDDKGSSANSIGTVLYFEYNSGKMLWTMGNGGGGKIAGVVNMFTSNSITVVDTYAVVTLRYTAAAPIMRLNGVENTDSFRGSPSTSDSARVVNIGRISGAADYWDGCIARIWIYQGNLASDALAYAEAQIAR